MSVAADTGHDVVVAEARGMLRAVVTMGDQVDDNRLRAGIPLDPTKADPDQREAAVVFSVWGAIDAIAGVGCLRDGDDLEPCVLQRVIPFLTSVETRATSLLDCLEDECGAAATYTPGFASAIEVLVAVQHLSQVALALWARG